MTSFTIFGKDDASIGRRLKMTYHGAALDLWAVSDIHDCLVFMSYVLPVGKLMPWFHMHLSRAILVQFLQGVKIIARLF